MLQCTYRPIERWPGEPTKSRRRSQFRASYASTLDLLESELRNLGAKDIVIQVDLDPRDIRNDGMLRSNAQPRTPRIILSFERKRGQQTVSMSYPCDRFTDWQDNLRAIGLSLQALRSVDRYGVTNSGEQYRGWERIGGPVAVHSNGFQSADEAAEFLAHVGAGNKSKIMASRDEMETAYRYACVATHPDRPNGSADTFKKVQAAKSRLQIHFGSSI